MEVGLVAREWYDILRAPFDQPTQMIHAIQSFLFRLTFLPLDDTNPHHVIEINSFLEDHFHAIYIHTNEYTRLYCKRPQPPQPNQPNQQGRVVANNNNNNPAACHHFVLVDTSFMSRKPSIENLRRASSVHHIVGYELKRLHPFFFSNASASAYSVVSVLPLLLTPAAATGLDD